jgi:hypothetical protein
MTMRTVNFDTSWQTSDHRVARAIAEHLTPGRPVTDDDIHGVLIANHIDVTPDRIRHGRLYLVRNKRMVKGPDRKPTTNGGYAQTWVMLTES